MDAKITKQRLSNLIAYDWVKILVVTVASIFALITLMSMVATKPQNQQNMYLIFYDDILKGTDNSSVEESYLSSSDSEGIFSYEIMETSSLYMSSDSNYAGMALNMRIAAGQYSIAVVSSNEDPDSEEREDGKKSTYLENCVSSYTNLIEPVNEYLSAAEEFLSSYYGGDVENGSLDEKYLEEVFRSRNKKDKRYRTEEEISVGLQDEKARIEKTRKSFLSVRQALSEGAIYIKETTTYNEYGEETGKGYYSICVGTERMASMNKYIYVSSTDENGTEVRSVSSLNIVFFYTLSDEENYMRFEKLNYLGYLLDTYLDKI